MVPINWHLVGPEIAYIVQHAQARAVIAQDDKDRRHGAALLADIGYFAAYAKELGPVGQGAAIKAVIMVATYKPAAAFIKQMRDRDLMPICTNISFTPESRSLPM